MYQFSLWCKHHSSMEYSTLVMRLKLCWCSFQSIHCSMISIRIGWRSKEEWKKNDCNLKYWIFVYIGSRKNLKLAFILMLWMVVCVNRYNRVRESEHVCSTPNEMKWNVPSVAERTKPKKNTNQNVCTLRRLKERMPEVGIDSKWKKGFFLEMLREITERLNANVFFFCLLIFICQFSFAWVYARVSVFVFIHRDG